MSSRELKNLVKQLLILNNRKTILLHHQEETQAVRHLAQNLQEDNSSECVLNFANNMCVKIKNTIQKFKNIKMKKQILITGAILLCVFSSNAQNDIDAMRYSQITFGGTARFASMAGSMGALGGDISTLSFNPAGIAIFKKTELSISTAVFSQTTTSVYNANTPAIAN